MRARMGALATASLLLVLSACGSSGDGQKPDSGAPTGAATVKVTDSDYGPILVDQSGRTLYAFTKDKNQTSNCGEACIAVWPALVTAKTVATGEGANAGLIGQIKPTDGEQQATYGEWPLYYYVGDMVAGDVNGQGIDGEWFVLSPDGTLNKKTD